MKNDIKKNNDNMSKVYDSISESLKSISALLESIEEKVDRMVACDVANERNNIKANQE